ncbi:spermidine synthase [Timonella senegalensis]|uniref:spermidine synthase n=1 Tax=Timonella senegalensis TaxID=1465825 RepID=UPI0002E962D5|nr:fused MFS/spermidine synthase [Timonella senegalensis]
MAARSSRSSSRAPLTSTGDTIPEAPITTAFTTIRLEKDRDNPRRITVYLDEAPSSFIDLDDPLNVGFEYMSIFLTFIEQLPEGPISVAHLGAAGSTMARAVAHVRPGSRQIGVDIDGELIDQARLWFDLPRSPHLKLRAGDARKELATLRDSSQDVIIRDVFADARTPEHLATHEFTELVLSKLKPGGLYLVNCADKPPLPIARQEVATLLSAAAAFDARSEHTISSEVAYAAETAIVKGRRFGNLVLVIARGAQDDQAGSAFDIESAMLARALRTLAIPAHILIGDDVRQFARTSNVLRDSAPETQPHVS